MADDKTDGLSEPEQEQAAEDIQAALEYDSQGRPVLAGGSAHQDALKQGYFGYDAKDLGAAVRPEDVGSFDENAARIDQPAHSESPVVESVAGVEGFSAASSAGVTPSVQGDATQADAPANTPGNSDQG